MTGYWPAKQKKINMSPSFAVFIAGFFLGGALITCWAAVSLHLQAKQNECHRCSEDADRWWVPVIERLQNENHALKVKIDEYKNRRIV